MKKIDSDIQELLATTNLSAVDSLYRSLCEDAETVSDPSNSTVSGIGLPEPLQVVADESVGGHPVDIMEHGSKNSDRGIATGLMNRLTCSAGVVSLVNHSVVVLDESTNEWKLTAYGRLVCYEAFSEDVYELFGREPWEAEKDPGEVDHRGPMHLTPLKDDVEHLYYYTLQPTRLHPEERDLVEAALEELSVSPA